LPIHSILGKNRLNQIPKGFGDNGRMFSGIGVALVGDLAAINAVLQHEMEGTARKLLPAATGTVSIDPPLALDSRFFQFGLEDAHRSQFYIAPEDMQDSASFVGVDLELSALHVVAKRR